MKISNTPLMNSDEIAHELSKRGLAWADAHAAFEALSDTTKTVLAEIARDWMDEGKSATEADTRGRADQRYKAHLKSLGDARRAANRAKVNYDTYKAWVEMQRTNASTERALATIR